MTINNKRTFKVSDKGIIGFKEDKIQNLYLVCWSRCANFGYDLMAGESEEQIINEHPFSPNNEVSFIVTKINTDSLPVVSKAYNKEGGLNE